MQSRSSFRRIVVIGLIAFVAAADAAGQVALPPGPGLGLMLEPTSAPAIVAAAPSSGSAPLTVRLTARWADVEREPGAFDWTPVREASTASRLAGYRVTLCLTGSNPLYLDDGAVPSPLDPASLDAWVRFVRSAVSTFATDVAVYEIWDGPARIAEATGRPAFDPSIYAFLLKRSALAARAEARAAGVEIAVAQGALDFGTPGWQQELWDADTAAYVDVLPLRMVVDDAAAGLEQRLATALGEVLTHPPAPVIWAYLEPAPGASDYATAGAAVRALAAGASLALGGLPSDDGRAAEAARWFAGAQTVLGGGFAPSPSGALELRDLQDRVVPDSRVLGRFLNDSDFTSLIVYDLAAAAGTLEQGRLIVDSTRVRNARSLDPLTGRELRTAAAAPEEEPGKRALRAPVAAYPMMMLFQRGVITPGFELPPEELAVESTRGLTAQEIIARNQQVQSIQDDHLDRWIAAGRIDFHFKLGQSGSTVDVGVVSNFFWERGGQLEWEQTDYYVNGNRVRWKNIPELPLIQPEKVITLPLDLTLDKTYAFRLAGEDAVAGRPAYVLAFDPVAPDAPASLYQGRVWIDKATFQRLKLALIQTRTGTPEVLSNEERDLFAPHEGPDGRTYWMLERVDGQQIWSAAGRNFIVRREVSFTRLEINPPQAEFEERRRRAYVSNNQMLRDTDKGFRYLERQEDGSRTVKEGMDTSQLFAAAGAFKDSSTDGVRPLAGVNYFNFDVAKKKIQMSVLFAGPLAFFTASKPNLFGNKISGTVDAAAVGIEFEDKSYIGVEERRMERVEQRPQRAALRLGMPVGAFFKITLAGSLTQREYSLDRDARSVIDRFNMLHTAGFEYRVPRDHVQSTAALELEYNRAGYTLATRFSTSKRSKWEEFGLFDAGANSFVTYLGGDSLDPSVYVLSTPEPVRDSFTRWSASLFKEWYLRKFQKVRGEANYLGGSDLDRFSRYEFSLFGEDRLNGFSGSGVRFDRGVIARAGYSFNLFEVIRLDATLDHARVTSEANTVGSQSFSGLGLSGNVIGPWKTVISLSYGRALDSDIPALEGEQEFLLLVLKLFK